MRHAEGKARPLELAQEVATAFRVPAGNQPDMQRDVGHRQRDVAPKEALGLQRAQQERTLRGKATQQRGDVDLGQDEADLTLGPVDVERTAQDHHHALGELDALLGQPVPQGRPGTAPTLDVQCRHAAAAPVAPWHIILGVDQAQVQVA